MVQSGLSDEFQEAVLCLPSREVTSQDFNCVKKKKKKSCVETGLEGAGEKLKSLANEETIRPNLERNDKSLN